MSAPVDAQFNDDTDWGLKAHQAAEQHLAACLEAMYAEDESDLDTWPEDMAGPFCGCETCVIREVLHAAWPILLQAAQAEADG